jgi:hypothetical protein
MRILGSTIPGPQPGFVCAEGNHQRGHSKTGAVQERRLWRRLHVEEKRTATGGGRRREGEQHQKKNQALVVAVAIAAAEKKAEADLGEKAFL